MCYIYLFYCIIYIVCVYIKSIIFETLFFYIVTIFYTNWKIQYNIFCIWFSLAHFHLHHIKNVSSLTKTGYSTLCLFSLSLSFCFFHSPASSRLVMYNLRCVSVFIHSDYRLCECMKVQSRCDSSMHCRKHLCETQVSQFPYVMLTTRL